MQFVNIEKHLTDFENKHKERITTCYNCGLGCKFRLSLPGGASTFVKCQSYFNFMFACQIQDLKFSLNCYHLCERYGMDVISTANLVGFAIDIYQKGILSKKDTEGMHLEWGNEKVAFSLIEKIAQREGIGEILANGVYEASRIIGSGAEEHAYHLKKLESIPYGMYRPYAALRSSVADKPDATRAEGYLAQEYLGASKKWKKEFIKSGYFSYPKELEKLFMDDFVGLERDYETIVPFTSYDADKNCIADCTGICIFWTGFWCYNPINLDDHISLVSYATGLDLDLNKTMSIAKRIGALTRAYNVITGIRRKNDRVPEKYFRITPKPPFFKLDKDEFNKMISKYYNLRGWNSEGIPSSEELNSLGLEFVRRDLEQREIL
jgi:aldehyde:ferredoxin oxidoreductase